MERFDFGGEIVWQPPPEYVERSRLKRFMDQHGITSVAELVRRSTRELDWFWNAVLEDLNIEFYEPYEKVIDTTRGIPWTRWCVGGKMNIVHNCLDKWVENATQNRLAIRWEGEDGRWPRSSGRPWLALSANPSSRRLCGLSAICRRRGTPK